MDGYSEQREDADGDAARHAPDSAEAAAGGADMAADDVRLLPDRLCRAVAQLLPIDGAAISIYLGGDVAVPVGANNLGATVGEALQFTLREGPCFDSYGSGAPVSIPDVRQQASEAWTRWPAYTAEISRLTEYLAVHAYPLMSSGTAIGSLSLYRHSHATPHDLHHVEGVAAQITDRLLETTFIADADGELAPRWLDSPLGLRRRQVWIAQGLILQANKITPGQAIDLLRARAYATDQLLDDLADDIASGRVPPPTLESDD